MKSNLRVLEIRVKEKKSEAKESEMFELFQNQEVTLVSYKHTVHVNGSGLKKQKCRE